MKLLGFYGSNAFIVKIPDDVVNEYPLKVLTGDVLDFHADTTSSYPSMDTASSYPILENLRKQHIISAYGMKVNEDAD